MNWARVLFLSTLGLGAMASIAQGGTTDFCWNSKTIGPSTARNRFVSDLKRIEKTYSRYYPAKNAQGIHDPARDDPRFGPAAQFSSTILHLILPRLTQDRHWWSHPWLLEYLDGLYDFLRKTGAPDVRSCRIDPLPTQVSSCRSLKGDACFDCAYFTYRRIDSFKRDASGEVIPSFQFGPERACQRALIFCGLSKTPAGRSCSVCGPEPDPSAAIEQIMSHQVDPVDWNRVWGGADQAGAKVLVTRFKDQMVSRVAFPLLRGPACGGGVGKSSDARTASRMLNGADKLAHCWAFCTLTQVLRTAPVSAMVEGINTVHGSSVPLLSPIKGANPGDDAAQVALSIWARQELDPRDNDANRVGVDLAPVTTDCLHSCGQAVYDMPFN